MAYCVIPLKKAAKRPRLGRGRASLATAILLVGFLIPKGRPWRTRLLPPSLWNKKAAQLHGLKPTAPLQTHATAIKVYGKMVIRVAATG